VRYLTTQEVARYCQVSSVTVGKWIDAGHLRGHRTPGGHRRVARADLVTFMRERGMPIPPELHEPAPAFTILVADADPEFRTDVARRLAERWPGARIVEAGHVVDALVRAGQLRPTLLLLDLGLAQLDAVQVCRRLAAIPGLEQTCVVALTRTPPDEARAPSGAAAAVARGAGADAIAEAAARALQVTSAAGRGSPEPH
jgi:excisionase family DNA binding protein